VAAASAVKFLVMRAPRQGPGDSELTRTPRGPASKARVRVRPSTAIFDAAYGVRLVSGRLPVTEAMLMTSPLPRRYMAGSRALHIR
jgi:hypothetical protein